MKKTYSAVLNYREGKKEEMRVGTISNFNKLETTERNERVAFL